MEFIGIGDLHLSASNGHGGFSRFVENSDEYILSEVQRVVDAGKERGIEQYLLYGDICDSVRMSYNAHILLIDFLKRNSDLQFHVILGNHDKLARKSVVGHSLELLNKFRLKNLHLYETPKVVKFEDCRINFLPYPAHEFKRCLNVCHLDLNGATMDNGRVMKCEVDAKGKQVVSGHIHSASHFRNTYYSGTLYQLTFGEDVSRKGYHVIDCQGDDADVQWIPFKPKYTLESVCVESPEVLSSLNPVNTFYRLLVPTDMELDPQLTQHLNVVSVKRWGTKTDLKDLQEFDLQFEDLQLDVPKLLNSILSSQYPKEAKEVLACRARILSKG